MYSGLCLFQMTLANILTALMGRAGVRARLSNLRIAFGESGASLDPLRARTVMDFEYVRTSTRTPAQAQPSEYCGAMGQGHVPVRFVWAPS